MDWFHPDKVPVCRPALPRDTPEILKLTSTIWEGGDYVPEVWQDWLEDTQGRLAVVEWGGRVVGLFKLSLLSPEEGWLEGLRVHPELEGRGFASRLFEYMLDIWTRMNGGVLRLATASFRHSVQHLSRRTGFIKAGEFTPYQAVSLAERAAGSPLEISLSSKALPPGSSQGMEARAPFPAVFRSLAPDEAGQALELVQHSPALELAWGFMDLGWSWARPSQVLLEEAAGRGQAWWWGPGREGVLVAREDTDEGVTYLSLQLLACPLADLADCLSDFRRLGSARGFSQVSWLAPLNPETLKALDASGYQRSWEASVFLYEKPPSNHREGLLVEDDKAG